MTRFARAKGSKASNERVTEDATSWAEMKQQLNEKKEAVENQKQKKHADAKRRENYDKFVKDVEQEELNKNQWADFPETITTQQKKQKQAKQVQKVNDDEATNGNIIDENDNMQAEASKPVTKKNIAKKRKLSNGNVQSSMESSAKPDYENFAKKKKKNKKKPEVVKPPKKKVEEMTEEERKKFDKKKGKKIKQLEKRKIKKQQLKEQKEEEEKNKVTTEGEGERTAVSVKPVNVLNNNKNIKQTKTPPKVKKLDANKEHKRRKPLDDVQKVTINGKEMDLVYFDGFPIKREDAERLTALRKQMISKGLPRSEVKTAMKLERRRAEKALSRDKKNVCYKCRKAGHVLSMCPEISATSDSVDTAATGICFKCGSTEHTSFVCKVVKSQEFRFASCFICNEQGHISWQCPDNARGLYPKGGGCKVCGDVTHLKKDCPTYVAEQEANAVSLDTLTAASNPDSLETPQVQTPAKTPRPNKIITF